MIPAGSTTSRPTRSRRPSGCSAGRRGRQAAGGRALAPAADEAAAGGADAARGPAQGPGPARHRAPERRLADRRDDAATPISRRATTWASSRWPRGAIADQQVRNRGTIGGSLVHGDPASDLPAVVLAIEGTVTAQGPGGRARDRRGRPVPGLPHHRGRPDEVVTRHAPARPRRLGPRVREVHPPRRGLGDGRRVRARRRRRRHLRGRARGPHPHGLRPAPRHRRGGRAARPAPGRAAIAKAAEHAGDGTDPPGDLNATPEYKRHLARVLTARRAAGRLAALVTGAGRFHQPVRELDLDSVDRSALRQRALPRRPRPGHVGVPRRRAGAAAAAGGRGRRRQDRGGARRWPGRPARG